MGVVLCTASAVCVCLVYIALLCLATYLGIIDSFNTASLSDVVWTYGVSPAALNHGYSAFEINAEKVVVRNKKQSTHRVVVSRSDWTFPVDYPTTHVEALYNTYDHIYTQNLDRSTLSLARSARTHAIPVGLDFHNMLFKIKLRPSVPWTSQCQRILRTRRLAAPLAARKQKVLVTWSATSDTSRRFVEKGYKSRLRLWKECAGNPVFEIGTGSRAETWKRMAECAFVYSPIGCGFGCYRTWEALTLGCIVVAQWNPALAEFADRFPIVFHDNPAEITPQDLGRWLAMYPSSTPVQDLRLSNFLPETRTKDEEGGRARDSRLTKSV
jgi:hypothetical protein